MGRLILIPTPVGNIEDITLRALRMLKEVDLILCEDTRTTGNLLRKYDIPTPTSSFHKFNEHKRLESLVGKMKFGESLALVSDAGTPGISDPGFLLVRECIRLGIEVECLPGATSFVPALVASGFSSDRFIFEGFLPHTKGRQKRLAFLENEERTMVFFEAPFRVLKTLGDFVEHFGPDRRISVAREISKMFEEYLRGSVKEILLYFRSIPPKGEFVLVVEGKGKGDFSTVQPE